MKMSIVFVILLMMPCLSMADVSDYLILNEIGSYRIIKETIHPITKKIVMRDGYTIEEEHAGVSLASIHFNVDHNDTTYGTYYESDVADLGVRVQITQHAGADSDQWLMHEIEDAYRDGNDKEGRLGLLTQGTRIRDIDGNKIIGMRGGGYNWVSNSILVDVSYTDLYGTKPEPLEILKAYLAKYPSSMILTDTEFKSATHNEKWIKDEMGRRLWITGKWLEAHGAGTAELKDTLYNTYKSLEVFLRYREKYFEVGAIDHIREIYAFKKEGQVAGMQAKAQELDQWWQLNKNEEITLP